MNCKKVLSKLNAYLDGALSEKRRREMEAHVSMCQACREQLEELGRVGEMLDFLEVPSLPVGFSARLMAEAWKQARGTEERKSLSPLYWRPVQWFAAQSFLMRTAACATVLVACLIGLFMSWEVSSSGSLDAPISSRESMEGLEWFSPTPPASLGSAYLTLALTTPEERDRP